MSTRIIPEFTEAITAPESGVLQPGEEIEGYRVDGILSTAGGEAEIYRCVKDGETFVLKYYHTKKPNPDLVEKIKSFSGRSIISILHYGEYKGKFFTILEYAAGGALDDKLSSGAYKYLPMNDDEVLQIVRETVAAFEACHKAGIIHRDIKPGNLLYKSLEILPDGRHKGSGIRVGDFGIASLFDADSGISKHITETGAKTEGYAAPEAYSGIIGPEMDYYSLGITLWVMLTGMEPFINENGQIMYSGHITLDTIQGKTAEKLLSRSPQVSASMQKLIRGLLTVRHDKRWKQNEVMRHLAGENVEVFSEVRTLPLVEIGGENCSSYQEIAHAIVKHPEEGKKFIFKGRLSNYLIKIDQKLTDRLLDVIERYSEENREDEGAVFVAFSLCSNMAFPLEHGLSVNNLEEMFRVLNTDPDAILPFLRDERKGFYAYLEAAGLGEHGRKVKEIVSATSGDIRAVSRIIAAFQGNEISPFQDGINNDLRLVSLEDMYNLPDYLKERAMIFIERNYGLLPAWIENLTGKDLDSWLLLLSEKKDLIARWGTWKYFTLFMQGLAFYDKIQKDGSYVLFEKDGKKALFRCVANAEQAELLCSVEVNSNGITLKKRDGAEVFSGPYVINFARGYDKDGVSTLPFIDADGRMAAFDGSLLYYFNISTGKKEPRYELKEGEIALLTALKNPGPIIDIARSLGEKNNFSDMNSLIDVTWEKFGTEKKYKDERDILLLIDKDRMECLSRSFDFYLGKIGLTYYFEQYYTEALSYSEKALELNPSNVESLVNKGGCLYNLGSYNDAIACLTVALGMRAEKRSVLPLRAQCYDALGMKDKANQDRAACRGAV